MSPRSMLRLIFSFLRYLLLGVISVTILYPLFWLGVNSMRSNSDVLADPYGLTGHWSFNNYIGLIRAGQLLQWIANSAIVNVVSVFLIVALATLAAYGFSTFEFRGKRFLFGLLVIGIMVPPQALVIAGYRWIQALGMQDSLVSLIVTYCGWTPFAILVLRDFFDSIPKELREAAVVDGASHFVILTRVFIPIARPALSTVIIFNIIWIWNDFIYPLVYLQSDNHFTIPVGVMTFNGLTSSQLAAEMAVLAVATAVPVLIYLVFRKQFARGVLEGAIKG